MSENLLIAPALNTPAPSEEKNGKISDFPDRATLLRHLGVPEHPDGYKIACDHGMFTPDTEINRRMHQLGFTPEQAQFVYDLAAEHLLPMVQNMTADFEAERQLQRLIDYFGGADQWRETSRQMLAWANKNLPSTAVEALSTTAEGVMAIHRLMTGGAEPATLHKNSGNSNGISETDLHKMMRDPRYWRDRNPDLVKKVTEGFRRLYPDEDNNRQ
ncbi:Tail assembly chaperone [Azospirillaceae bacterium]